MNTKKKEISETVWEQIRIEYISTDTSYRQLEKKYGVSYSKIQGRARRGDWLAEKAKFKSERTNKSISLLCEEQAKEIVRAILIGNKMLDKIEQALDELDRIIVKRSKTVKTVEKIEGQVAEVSRSEESYEVQDNGLIDRDGLKQLTVAFKNLKEIGVFRAELDKREQEARIKKLEKDTEDEQAEEIILRIESGEEYGR